MLHQMPRVLRRSWLALCVGSALSASAWALEPTAPRVQVGDTVITEQAYQAAFNRAARDKFFHGTPPQAEVAALQRKVAQDLADQILFQGEIARRKIQADTAVVQKQLADYDARYANSDAWKANRDKMLPGLKARLESDNQIDQLAALARQTPPPTDAEVQAYWKKHPDKFTTPEQVHVAMVLLKVDPSSPQTKWDAALAEAKSVSERAHKGMSLAELARMHSSDASANQGGDLGWLHKGQLPDAAQAAVDALKVKGISPPVQLLEGMAVFQLLDRKPAQLNSLDKVRDRARGLLARERADAALDAFKAQLRKSAKVTIDESGFLPLGAAAKP